METPTVNITNVKYTKNSIKMPSIGWLKFGPKIKVSRSVGSFVQSKRWLKSVPKDKPWKTADVGVDSSPNWWIWLIIIHQPPKRGVSLGWFPLLFGVMWLWSRYNSAGKMRQNLQLKKIKKLFIFLGSLDVSSAWLKLAPKVKLWRPAGNDTLLRFWLKSSPKVTCWRFEGKFTLSKLWLYLSPNVRLSRLLQVVRNPTLSGDQDNPWSLPMLLYMGYKWCYMKYPKTSHFQSGHPTLHAGPLLSNPRLHGKILQRAYDVAMKYSCLKFVWGLHNYNKCLVVYRFVKLPWIPSLVHI